MQREIIGMLQDRAVVTQSHVTVCVLHAKFRHISVTNSVLGPTRQQWCARLFFTFCSAATINFVSFHLLPFTRIHTILDQLTVYIQYTQNTSRQLFIS